MNFLLFLYKKSGRKGLFFIALGILAGLTNASILNFINFMVQSESISDIINADNINIYFLVILIFFLSQRAFTVYLIRLSQHLIFETRLKILDQIRNSKYVDFVRIGKENFVVALTQDTEQISAAASAVVYAINYFITISFCIAYLAYVSWFGFLMTLGVLFLGISIYWIRQRKIQSQLNEARNLQSRFFKHIDHLLNGFKEVKLDRSKNTDLYENHLKQTGEKVRNLSVKAILQYLDNSLSGQLLMLVLIGFILFVFPLYSNDHATVISYIFIILYIIGPLEGLMAVIPSITQAEIALSRIRSLEQQLQESGQEDYTVTELKFEALEMREVTFEYTTEKEENFCLGPLNFRVNKGEIIFIIGGNGSGKTTFFNILTGLYDPSGGTIQLNETKLESSEYQSYRNLFAPVFSDFHLFDIPYGNRNYSDEDLQSYLKIMQLEEKVTVENGAFSTTALSTGQRKRLALILAILEDKPVIVLDEWAADQDPVFRSVFYKEILPDLKSKGKTIIAITHDDKYFDGADQRYKMEYGKMERIVS